MDAATAAGRERADNAYRTDQALIDQVTGPEPPDDGLAAELEAESAHERRLHHADQVALDLIEPAPKQRTHTWIP